jgi:hypothetical protein
MRKSQEYQCYVCRHPWRNIIDLEILEDKPTGTIFMHLPVTPSIPIPTQAEISTHRRKGHMRPREQILKDQAEKLKLLNAIIDDLPPRDLLYNSLAQDVPPPLPAIPPPAPVWNPHLRLSQKPPEAAWTPHVLRSRQRRTGWTPEAQIALRDHQENACAICGSSNPTCMDVFTDALSSERVLGYLCQRCKGVMSMMGHDPELFYRACRYLDRPPSQELMHG